MSLITAQNGWSYNLTPDDLLWAARMIYGEGGNSPAVLWTMASHLALARGSSFTNTIRAYSQPINPIWYADGSKCRPGGTAVGSDGCAPSRLAKRAMIASLQPAGMPAAWALVQRWAAGQIPNPVPTATEFADPTVSASCLAGTHGDCARLILADGNWYMASRGSVDWPANYVRIDGTGDAPSSGGIGVGGVAVGLGLGYALWRWLGRRR